MNDVGETLRQTPLAVALLGDESVYTGRARSLHYRWFTDPASRLMYPAEDHEERSRTIVSHLHATYTRAGAGSYAASLAEELKRRSPEFAALWERHPVAGPYCAVERLDHPRVGRLDLHCQTLIDPDQAQGLVVYTATPGTKSYEKLALLSVVGVL